MFLCEQKRGNRPVVYRGGINDLSLFKELKRRNVFRVGIAYVVGGWLLLQLTEVLSELLKLPDEIGPIVVAIVAIGLPIALFFAWAYELTPDGVKREADVGRSQSITTNTGRKLDFTIIGLLVLGMAYFIWESRFQDDSDVSAETSIAETKQDSTVERLSIAVLPFANRSNREEDQFFTDGIHDDLLTTIAQIGSMKVISRTSVMEYKNTTKNIRQIAKELGVTNILEGGIQRSGNQVRINVQLIDARTDEHLWAEIFDRELTAENLFAIQSEISQKIAAALQATLSPEEVQRINTVPTQNLAAYDAYLHGRQLIANRISENLEQAVEEFAKAVELDPEFALAWVGVADSHLLLSTYGTLDRTLANSVREDAIQRALTIDNALGEAYASLGSLYDDSNRSGEAEKAFQKAIELSPNYATAYHWYANYLASFPLRSRETLELARKAIELDPRSRIIGAMLGGAYVTQGLYSLAERQFQKVVELNPDFSQGHSSLVLLYAFSIGQFDKAIIASRKASELDPGNIFNLMLRVAIYTDLDDMASAETIRRQMDDLSTDHFALGFADMIIAWGNQNPGAMREAINWVFPKVKNLPELAYSVAQASLATGDKDRSREIYLAISPGWMIPGQWQALIDQYAFDACVFSWLLMNTGDEELGTQLLQQTTQFLDVDLAAVNEHVDLQNPDACYLTAGDTEKALLTIETQLAHNHLAGWTGTHQLPMYDLIRHEPRYQAALAERERRIAVQRENLARMDAEAGP